MSNRADKLFAKAERYLSNAEFFCASASEYRSASRQLTIERADWLKALDGLVIRYDGFQERVDDYDRIAKQCEHRQDVYTKKHDRTMRHYYRYIGKEIPTFLEKTEYFLEREWWAILRRVGYGRYFGPKHSVRRRNDPRLF